MNRNILFSLAAVLGCNMANAQQSINIVKGNVAYSFNTENTGIMNYSEGKTLNILGNIFNLSDIERVSVKDMLIDDNTVLVEYNDESSFVSIAGNLTPYVSAEVAGSHVVINQGNDVSESTCGEITYILKGASSNGSLTLNGSYKATIELQGLTLTNPSGAALDIENGKRIDLSAKNGTVNSLVDGAGGKQKAALYCKGHLELKGKGELNITGNTAHAIAAKEYVEVKNLTLNILGAVKDGINCSQYFLMESGTVSISGIGEDGIQTSYKDDKNREDEDTGTITISGGTLDISVTADAAKALKADNDIEISGGVISAIVSGNGIWDSEKSKTKASACIGADNNVIISGGSLELVATGSGGKGISCDNEFTQTGGDVNITTSGGMLVYTNGSLNHNYTGNTDRIDSDMKSSPKGVKADGNITISGGEISVKATGNGAEGIESKSDIIIDDAIIFVRAYDDGINSSGNMYVNGGSIDVVSANNDGLDANKNIYISGGVTMAFGAGGPECGIDANEEEGYTVYFTGGYLLASGGRNSVPNKSGSTQPYVTANLTISGGDEISVSSESETLYKFNVPSDYKGSGGNNGGRPGGGPGGNGSGNLLISVEGMNSGSSYTLSNGSAAVTAIAK